jgi:predicted transcriptional regulator
MTHAAKRKMPVAPTETVATTIKLPEETRERARVAAEAVGQTMHAFLVGAVEQVISQSEKRREFVAEARAAEEEVLHTGKSIPHAAAAAYFKARAEGKNPARPKAVKWRK